MKAKLYSVLILLSSSIYLILVYKGYKEQNIDLNAIEKHAGRVLSVRETIRKSSKNNSKVFFINIEGLGQMLGVYRMSKDYNDLLVSIKTGDFVTVYFNKDYSNDINIDLVQLEKAGRIIIDKKEFQKKESALIWIGLLGTAYSIFLSVNYYRKNVLKRQEKRGMDELRI